MLNLTQHKATSEQLAVGVVNLNEDLSALLTFEALPSREDLESRALAVANVASQYPYKTAMIGGAPYFMPYLIKELEAQGIKAYFAFSARESVESIGENGEVVKTSRFAHKGFVEAC